MKLQTYIILLFLMAWIMKVQSNNPFNGAPLHFTSNNYYSIYIMDKGKSSVEDLQNMLLFYKPEMNDSLAFSIAKLYVEESFYEGVNHDIAFCQMILETGFLTYGGSVQRHQNNFCGLGATHKNAKGESFPDIRTGVRAHIQHLKAYASYQELLQPSVDNRFKYVKRGSAKTIYALKGKWAMDPYYDQKLENLLDRLFFIRHLSHQSTQLSLTAF